MEHSLKRYLKLLVLALSLIILGCSVTDENANSKLKLTSIPAKSYNHRVQFLVMHYTATDYQGAIDVLANGPYVSSHYLIPESKDNTYNKQQLQVIQLVDESDRAWHAGVSYWQGRKNINDQSIGIEIVNSPICSKSILTEFEPTESHQSNQLCLYPDFDNKQIDLLIELSKNILKRHPDIEPTKVVGHSDIAPSRKQDPGPRFPWYQLYKNGIGAWYDEDAMEKYWLLFEHSSPSIGLVQAALANYGYDISETGQRDNRTYDVVSAFQMHFLPWKVDGQVDAKVAAAAFALLEKYFPEKSDKLLDQYFDELLGISELSMTPLSKGQIDIGFPLPSKGSEYRNTFVAQQGMGELVIENVTANSIEIYVNGEKLNIDKRLRANKTYRYSLSKRTKSGINTFAVKNVEPLSASLNIRIPFLTINSKSRNSFDFSSVDELINNEVKAGFPGAALLIMKNGKIIKKDRYGYKRKFSDNGTKLKIPERMLVDTLFDLASNTKMFATNLALMKLVSEGRLDVNNPVDHYLKYYQGGGRELRLVKDLLTHTAGYAPEVQFYRRDNRLGSSYFSQNANRTKQLLTERVPFSKPRGGKPRYSDTDYMLLGMIVEAISGQQLDDYVEQHIYRPLGLTNTLFNPLRKGFTQDQFAATEIFGNTRGSRLNFSNIRRHVLQGEVHDEKAFYSMDGVSGHAGLFSNLDEMAVLAQLMLNRGGYGEVQIFKPEVMDNFVKPIDQEITMGMGWRRNGESDRRFHFGDLASHQAFGHTGWTGTVTVIDPMHDLAIILLTNKKHSELVGEGAGLSFAGDKFETGRYRKIITMIYQAILEQH